MERNQEVAELQKEFKDLLSNVAREVGQSAVLQALSVIHGEMLDAHQELMAQQHKSFSDHQSVLSGIQQTMGRDKDVISSQSTRLEGLVSQLNEVNITVGESLKRLWTSLVEAHQEQMTENLKVLNEFKHYATKNEKKMNLSLMFQGLTLLVVILVLVKNFMGQ